MAKKIQGRVGFFGELCRSASTRISYSFVREREKRERGSRERERAKEKRKSEREKWEIDYSVIGNRSGGNNPVWFSVRGKGHEICTGKKGENRKKERKRENL